MVDLNSLLGQFAPGGGGQSSPMSMPLLGSPAYQQQQGQRRQAASQLEIQQALDLARALQQQASPDNERITSPWQVVGKMAQALGGQLQMRQAAQLEQGRRAALGNAYESAFPSESDLGGAGGGAGTPGQSADLSYGSGVVPMDVAKAAIAANESGGNYGEVGPTTHGGNALGKYQVMSYDLPQRLADAGLPPMTAAEFLRNPQAQERQFEHEFGGLMQKHGNFNDAASVWFSGRPMAAAGNASDGYMTVPQYIGKANATIARLTGANGAAAASPTGGQASAFSPGGPGGNAPNGAMAIADALAGGQQAAGGPHIAAGAPSGAGGSGVLTQPQTGPYGPVYVDPRYLPRRPVINRQAFQTIMALGGPEDQTRVLQMLQAQQQPIEVQRPWGKIVVDPQNPLRQQFVSNEDKSSTKVEGMEIPTRTTYDYMGRPNVQYLLPGGQVGGIQDLAAIGSRIHAQKEAETKRATLQPDITGAEARAAGEKTGAETTARAQAETAPGIVAAEAGKAGTIEGAKLRAANTPEAIEGAAQRAATVKGAEARATGAPDIMAAEAELAAKKKTAELGAELTPGVPERQTEIAAAKKKGESQAEADVKQYSALHAGLAGAGMTASDQLDYIKVARGILNDPNFYSGIGENAVFNWNKVRSALGIDPTASLPQEAFRKIMAANILQQVNNLRAQQEAMGEKGGRIFASQIDMMEKAAQNPDNSVAGNKFLTETAWRGAQRSRAIADMADDYKLEHGALDAGFEKNLRKWMGENPMFTAEELGNLRRIGQTPAQQTVPSTVAGSAPAPTPSTARKYNPVTGKIE